MLGLVLGARVDRGLQAPRLLERGPRFAAVRRDSGRARLSRAARRSSERCDCSSASFDGGARRTCARRSQTRDPALISNVMEHVSASGISRCDSTDRRRRSSARWSASDDQARPGAPPRRRARPGRRASWRAPARRGRRRPGGPRAPAASLAAAARRPQTTWILHRRALGGDPELG